MSGLLKKLSLATFAARRCVYLWLVSFQEISWMD
jgi:hypothetical protein